MKKHRKRLVNKVKLIAAFALVTFCITTVSMASVFQFYRFVNRVSFLDIDRLPPHIEQAVLAMFSLITGIVFAVIFKRVILNPLYAAYDALDNIAEGDYKVEIEPKGIKTVRTVAKRINSMAKELDSIETMRNNFVNNFSHEFKTPIISIEGFAKILRDESLTEAERDEYLSIIISESRRLAELSTDILALNKLENQAILSGQTTFNVSEQIRLCVVLLENKWAQKNITFDFEGEDYDIYANENLLQQLWINIIDNAIKYSPEKSAIKIRTAQKGQNLFFTFEDEGKGMTDEEMKHAFERFYQADLNHKTGGNGIGLPVAKKICELHEGEISMRPAEGGGTTVEVKLPVK